MMSANVKIKFSHTAVSQILFLSNLRWTARFTVYDSMDGDIKTEKRFTNLIAGLIFYSILLSTL
jgi:hypothetical protein